MALWGYGSCIIPLRGGTLPDYYWQLSEGLSLLHGHWPALMPASFGIPATTVWQDYWLYEIGIALLYRMGNDLLVSLTFILLT